MIRTLRIGLIVCLVTAHSAMAGGLGVSAEDRARFLAEAREIAEKPPADERLFPILTEKEQAVVDVEPEMAEAWRSDPEATLDLIRRIIEAAEKQ